MALHQQEARDGAVDGRSVRGGGTVRIVVAGTLGTAGNVHHRDRKQANVTAFTGQPDDHGKARSMSGGRAVHLVTSGGPEVQTGSHAQVPSMPNDAGLMRSLGTSPGVLRSWRPSPQLPPGGCALHEFGVRLPRSPRRRAMASPASSAWATAASDPVVRAVPRRWAARSSHLFDTHCRPANGEVSR
jgi:hypothetical protein